MGRYSEPIAGSPEKGPACLVRTPGIALVGTAPTGPGRGLWPGDHRLFLASGSHAYEMTRAPLTGTPTFIDHGYIGNDGNPAQFFPNGNQLFIASDGLGWLDSGSGAQPIYYSIQQFDLAIDGSDDTLLTGPSGGIFDASDVGQTIQITSGTGFIVQSQVIISVNGSGEAKGGGSWGTVGSTGGEGIEWLYAAPYAQLKAFQGAFLDGYFFANAPDSNQIQFSANEDGTQWNPLDYFSKSSYPDNVAAMQADHQELYTFGDLESSEVFQDTGAAATPFSPDPGAIMHYGCAAPFSVARLSEGLAFIGGDVRRGDRLAFLAVGFRPQRISTAAVEIAWASYTTVEDAIAYTEIYRGHQFYVVHFPSGSTVIAGATQTTPSVGATWAYDLTTGTWHQRGWWNGTTDANGFPVFNCQRQRFHAVAALGGTNTEEHYVQDWQNGNIYVQDETLLNDNGTTIYRVRIAPHLTQENQRAFYFRFECDCDVTGLQRIYFNRLGYGRDRIWALVDWQPSGSGVSMTLMSSDTRGQSWNTYSTQSVASGIDVTLANAYLTVVPGTL
jgi:hypothetical protein